MSERPLPEFSPPCPCVASALAPAPASAPARATCPWPRPRPRAPALGTSSARGCSGSRAFFPSCFLKLAPKRAPF